LFEHLFGGAARGVASALGGGGADAADLVPRQRGEVEAGVSDAELRRRRLARLEVLDRDAERVRDFSQCLPDGSRASASRRLMYAYETPGAARSRCERPRSRRSRLIRCPRVSFFGTAR